MIAWSLVERKHCAHGMPVCARARVARACMRIFFLFLADSLITERLWAKELNTYLYRSARSKGKYRHTVQCMCLGRVRAYVSGRSVAAV